MHDIIIDDTKNCYIATSQRDSKPEKQTKSPKSVKKNNNFTEKLINWIIKALILSSLISINFLIYAGAGSYNMFSATSLLTPEVWMILGSIFVISFFIMYIFSFSELFSNLIISVVVYYFVIAMLNQFAAFDKNAMLSSMAATYISPDLGLLLTYVSHIVVAIILAILSFFFLTFSSKTKIFGCLIILIMFNLLIVFTQFSDKREHQKFNILKEEVLNIKNASGKNFIFIGLPGLSSYSYLDKTIKELPKNSPEIQSIQKTMNIMLGFYAQNHFQLYPQAYVNYLNPAQNFAQSLNANSAKSEQEYRLKNIYADRFWNFNQLNNKDVYLKQSRIYDTFKKAKYNINAYQNSGIELCKIDNEMAVNRCVERNSLPIDIDNMNLTTKQKMLLLTAQWLESTGLFSNLENIYTPLKSIVDVDKFPLVGISYKNIDIKNSANVLDIVAQDIKQSNGNTAYFINLALPSDTFIYDEFCKIKPREQWINKNDVAWIKTINTKDKREAYADQLRCVYGSLQKFINDIKKQNKEKDTVIFIQGLSGLNGIDTPTVQKTFLDEFMNQKFVDVAIKDPLKGDFKLNNISCSAPNILKQYLYRQKTCPEYKEFKFTNNLLQTIKNTLHKFQVSETQISQSVKQYEDWYKEWQKQNIPQLIPDKMQKNEIEEERIVKPINDGIILPIKEEPEAQIIPLKKQKKK